MKRFNGVVKGLGEPVLFFVVAMVIGIVPVAVAAEPLKVAAVFESPIEEPWVNQIHVTLVKARNELGIVYDYSESVKSAWWRPCPFPKSTGWPMPLRPEPGKRTRT